MRCIFKRKNVDKVQRNGQTPESKTIIRYVTQTGTNGVNGEDSYQVVLSPNNKTFTAGSYNAVQQDYEVMVYAYRGTSQINALVNDASITGTIAGALDVSIESGSNGTDHTKLILHVKENLTADAGELRIPVQYNVDSTDASSNYIESEWDPETNSLATYEAIYSWTLGKTGQSMYVLDLSNENASINADASGNIISGAMRPSCTAVLNFGASPVDGAEYSISYPSDYGVQGVSINQSTGVMTFNPGTASTPFSFGDHNDPNDTVLEITIDASYDGRVRGRKVMTITKALPGQSGVPGDPGEDAVSRWIELSANQVKIDASNNIVPSTITATRWKQVGGNPPVEDQSTNIKWFHDSSAEQLYTTPVDVSINWNNITFKLYDGSTFIGETETVPILKDGKQGEQGIRGAAVRGPILWDSSVSTISRIDASTWFYCGVQTHFGPNPPARPQESEFIDIILHDGQYYRCIDNYEQGPNATWSSVSNKWQVADSSYEFVAANLLLAENAKINFLTNNELYLVDNNNNITGGAAGGTGINFWAGHQNPSSAPFQVNYDGTMIASKGQFGCLTIGHDSSRNIDRLEGSVTTADGSTGSVEVSPCYIVLDSSTEHRRASITVDDVDNRYEGIIDVSCGSDEFAFWSDNGIVKAGSLEVMKCSTPANTVLDNSGHMPYFSKSSQGGGAVTTPGLFGLEVCFISARSNFDYSGSTWKFCGMDLRIPVSEYPRTYYVNGVAQTNPIAYIGRTSSDNKYNAYWAFVKLYNGSVEDYVVTGIAVKNNDGTTSITKLPNVLYITL